MPANDNPRVSVCIANFQGELLLADCLDSVISQQFHGELEVIVHDDASRDGSLDLLRRRYPSVVVIESEANVGFCVANNRMAARASGDYLLLLNNDAALLPGALDALVQAAGDGARGILSIPQYRWSDGALVDRGCLLDLFNNPVPNLDAAREEVAMVIGACLFIPRELWRELGGFPEWMGSLAEDLFLCCAARLRGYPVRVLAASGYRHHQGESFGGGKTAAGRLRTTYRRRALSERNKTLALATQCPAPLHLPLLLLHLALLCTEGLALTLARRELRLWQEIYWPALKAPVAQRILVAAQRKLQQRARRTTILQYFRTVTLAPRKLALLWRHGIPDIRKA